MQIKALEPAPQVFENDEEIKRAALHFVNNAWNDALAFGVDSDAVAHAALFSALVDLVSTYGEEAVADLVETLPGRLRGGDYSTTCPVQ